MSLLKKKYRVAIVLLFAGLACGSVRAQDTPIADVATGYSLIVVTHGYSLTFMGGSTSVAFNVNNWLGAVGDLVDTPSLSARFRASLARLTHSARNFPVVTGPDFFRLGKYILQLTLTPYRLSAVRPERKRTLVPEFDTVVVRGQARFFVFVWGK